MLLLVALDHLLAWGMVLLVPSVEQVVQLEVALA